MPDIKEQRPPRPWRSDFSGLSGPRCWNMLAKSPVDALIEMLNSQGIKRGAIYTAPDGSVPDPFCICQSIEAATRVPAIAGGLGLYEITAEYATVELAPTAARPGGPVRWSVRPSMHSEPVDHDINGHLILSSSGETPDPPITALRAHEILHGDFYVPGADEVTAYIPFRPFNECVNIGPLPRLGIDVPACLLIHVFLTEPSDTGWIHMGVDMEYKPPKTYGGITYGGWVDVFPDRGTRYRNDGLADDALEKDEYTATDTSKTAGGKINLDGNGRSGPATQVQNSQGQSIPPGTFRAVMNYKAADFSRIPFPT